MPDDRTVIIEMADMCVKCAQCLPHCPTWRLDRDETESPRGRIALMQALAEGMVPTTDLSGPIDRCLGCRHCERVCPAEVPYGAMLTRSRATLADPTPRTPMSARLLRWAVARPRLFARLIAPLARMLARLFRHPALPPTLVAPPAPGTYGSDDAALGEVQLFVGCVAAVVDGATLVAARDVLVAAGYRVRVPDAQACCGALHRHGGDASTADRLTRINRAAFAGDAPVAVCASGCAAELADDMDIGDRVADVSTLVGGRLEAAGVGTETALHTPCTLASVLDSAGAPAGLLDGARALPSRGRCCGGAGEYLLRHPDIAARLRDEVLDDIGDAETVCTSNVGCALHLREGLRRRGSQAVVNHPVVEWQRRVHTS